MHIADLVTIPEVLSLEEDRFDQGLTAAEIDALLAVPVKDTDFWKLDSSVEIVPGTPPSADPKRTKPTRKRKHKDEIRDDMVGSQGVGEGPQVSSIEDITMKEVPSFVTDPLLSPQRQIPEEQDLPMMTGEDLAQLLGVPEEPLPPGPDQMPTSTPAHGGPHPRTNIESPILSQTLANLTPERVIVPGIPEVPEMRNAPPSPGVTQLGSPQQNQVRPRESLQLELAPVTPSPGSKRRRKQLTFADTETQISRAKMRENMETTSNIIEPFVLKDFKGTDANELLAKSADKALHKEPWLSMWKKMAVFRRNIPENLLSHAVTPPHEIPEIQLEIEQMQQAGIPQETLQPPEQHSLVEGLSLVDENSRLLRVDETSLLQAQLSPVMAPPPHEPKRGRKRSSVDKSIEEMRKIASLSESGARIGDISLTDMEKSTQEGERTRTSTKRRTLSTSQPIFEDVPTQTPSVSSFHTSSTGSRVLFDVVEEPLFPFIAVPIREEVADTGFLMDMISSIEQQLGVEQEDYTTFADICPPEEVDRKTAATKFHGLLELCARRRIKATQDESYGEIQIRLAE
ncbi:uncharacterized protein LOC128210933 [Mya arenaria]|uniref:uncharacterized protein LOC128210933 n=1 Tax=Mya arenaria TaxID=6604 RepID=UPI0022E06FBF|nr:uncharacterized protein LOC128210933 [Mya arenaria]